MVYIKFRSLYDLQEYVLMLVTSTIETNFWLLRYQNKVIDIINFSKPF